MYLDIKDGNVPYKVERLELESVFGFCPNLVQPLTDK